MRLLDARTLQFKEIDDPRKVPKYAILSHTWAEKEVVFSDLISSSPELAHQRPEFAKVKFTAEQALRDGLDYIWVDTCCIDKSSSAELSEIINSMFRLYKKAEVCYIYLTDVTEPSPAGWTDDGQNDDAWTAIFTNARWFTRGWTLQELIAPQNAVFYTRDWRRIGTKGELCQTIARKTNIPSTILLGVDFRKALVAERMNWASKRSTTRVEDQAYCLLGLFDINMPLLYGEGERAFLRLQHEIIKKTNDRSIFLWTAIEKSHTSFRNLFARTPAEFASFHDYDLPAKYGRFEVTQSGLEIGLPLIEVPGSDLEYFGVVVDAGQGLHCVCLRNIGPDGFARVDAHEIFRILNPDYNPFATKNPRPQLLRITVPNTFDDFIYDDPCIDYRLGGIHVEYYPIELQIHSVVPSYAWNQETNTLELDCSKSMKPFEDGLKIVFSQVSCPETPFEVDLIDEMRNPSTMKTIGYSSPNKTYGYIFRMTKRFVGDKMMNVVRIDYQIYEEGGMKISSEKNPLPGRYTSYRNPSKEEHAKLIETWARERQQEDGKATDSNKVVEKGDSSKSENDDVAHMPNIAMRDGDVKASGWCQY